MSTRLVTWYQNHGLGLGYLIHPQSFLPWIHPLFVWPSPCLPPMWLVADTALCLHPQRGLPVRLSVGMSMHDPSSVWALHALVHVPAHATLQVSWSVVCHLCVWRAHFLCFKPTVLVVLTMLLACFWCSVLLGLLWRCSVVIVCSLLLFALADITIRQILLFSLWNLMVRLTIVSGHFLSICQNSKLYWGATVFPLIWQTLQLTSQRMVLQSWAHGLD